ncbi:helix-turn-helix domain-containing protein [Microvirga massiliensis]|uniref:helix-turn-helix domain-containing protein n=1 Tax=Microvirga massiliensis TaxID=1033741 RepID=UPI00062B5B17|nr:helix-turn-helix transcriptional regulator [Microvirga massiliensis]
MRSLCPEQCRAARGLLDWSQERLAAAAGVSRSTIRDFECGRHELHRSTEALLVNAFEMAGVCFLPSGHQGPGVRLQKCPASGDPGA